MEVRWFQTAELCHQHILNNVGQSCRRSECYRPEGWWWDRRIRAVSGIEIDPATSRYVRQYYSWGLDLKIRGQMLSEDLPLVFWYVVWLQGRNLQKTQSILFSTFEFTTQLSMLAKKMYSFGKKSKTVENRLSTDRRGKVQILESW